MENDFEPGWGQDTVDALLDLYDQLEAKIEISHPRTAADVYDAVIGHRSVVSTDTETTTETEQAVVEAESEAASMKAEVEEAISDHRFTLDMDFGTTATNTINWGPWVNTASNARPIALPVRERHGRERSEAKLFHPKIMPTNIALPAKVLQYGGVCTIDTPDGIRTVTVSCAAPPDRKIRHFIDLTQDDDDAADEHCGRDDIWTKETKMPFETAKVVDLTQEDDDGAQSQVKKTKAGQVEDGDDAMEVDSEDGWEMVETGREREGACIVS